jgi:hypothetical protein
VDISTISPLAPQASMRHPEKELTEDTFFQAIEDIA